MRKLIRNWNYLFNEIDNQNLIKKAGKRVDIFSFIVAFIIILLPYMILLFNVLFVYSSKIVLFHIFLWTIPIFFNLFISCWYTFTYQLLKNYLDDEPLLESTNSKKVFFGGLLNPITIISSIILTIIMEFIL